MSDEQKQESPVEDKGPELEQAPEPAVDDTAEIGTEEEIVNDQEDHGFVQDRNTGTVRNAEGKVVYARPGTMDAAVNGVQEDASGHMTSANFTHSDKSNTRI